MVPGVGWFQYMLFCGLCDLFMMHQDPNDEPRKLRTRLFGGIPWGRTKWGDSFERATHKREHVEIL